MPGKGPFTFRQRAGRLDWRKVSSVDVEDVVLHLKVEELQALLDTITFSEFDALEVKSNTIDHVTKLVNLMQLTIEYLLHHQEHQFHLVRKQNKKIHHLIDKNESYQRRLETLKEDVRTYQRQLHILRKSIQAGGGGINTELLFRLVQKEPKINDPSALSTRTAANPATSGNGDHPMNMELVKLMLDHEHDARATMHQMLEEQRRLFQSELSNLHETIRRIQHEHEVQQASHEQQASSTKDAWNTATISLLLENMKAQMENTARQMMDSIKENLPRDRPPSSSLNKTPASSSSSNSSHNNVEDILKQAAMETYSRELSEKEAALQVKEQELKRREALLQQSLQAQQPTGDTTIMRRKCALSLLFHVVRRWNLRRTLKRFRQWRIVVEDGQRQEVMDEHAKQLLFASEKRVQQDSQVHLTLQEERQKLMILQARYNALQRELDALQEASKFNELKAEQADRTEAVLQEKVKMEREKAVIAQAKYSALQQRLDKEKEEMQAKLQIAEEIIAQQAGKLAEAERGVRSSLRGSMSLPKRQDEGVMTSTSMQFLSPVRPVATATSTATNTSSSGNRLAALAAADTLLARQKKKLFPQLESPVFANLPVGGSLSEDILLRGAEERILAKNDVEMVKQLAMATLAQDFLAKYK